MYNISSQFLFFLSHFGTLLLPQLLLQELLVLLLCTLASFLFSFHLTPLSCYEQGCLLNWQNRNYFKFLNRITISNFNYTCCWCFIFHFGNPITPTLGILMCNTNFDKNNKDDEFVLIKWEKRKMGETKQPHSTRQPTNHSSIHPLMMDLWSLTCD